MKIDRLFVVSLGAITGLASCSSGQEEEAQRPNILILLADDAGYADFGFMGATDIQTPNIDRLAAEGCIFTDAHVAATVSSPSRSMMLTGRYGQRYGYECNLDKPGDGLPDDEELLPALLKRYDYRTGCIGKWHLGSEPSQRPNAKGFDTFYGLLAGHRSYFYDPETSDKDGNLQQYQYNGRKLSFDGYFTDELASKAQQFVTESEQPFMLYMSFTAPHSPNEATEEDLARFEGQPRQKNPNKISDDLVLVCEEQIDALSAKMEDNGYFILPGGSLVSAHLQLARTIVRRAERRLWTLNRKDPVSPGIMQFVNRLSDLFFTMARYEMFRQGNAEERWQSFLYKRKK